MILVVLEYDVYTKKGDSRLKEFGMELFHHINHNKSIFSVANLKNQVLKLSTLNESLQIQLFRFVDVLPNLKSEKNIINILAEYIDESDIKAGFLVKPFAAVPVLSGFFKEAVKHSVEFMAKTFICGRNVEEAMKTIKKLEGRNQTYTLDLLGEVALTQKEADDYYNTYIELLENIPEAKVSIKLSAIVPQVNLNNFEEKKQILKTRLRHLFRLAKENNATVGVDSEHYSWHELIFDVVQEVLEEEEFYSWDKAGIVIQAYLKDSEKDLDRWLAWSKKRGTKMTVRLVKGAYWDHERAEAIQNGWEIPVFEKKVLTDMNYEKLSEKLISATDYVRPAFASHNVRSLANILRLAEEKDISKDDFEFQVLYGMLGEMRSYFSRRGYCLRVYLPYGQLLPGMSYLVRRLLENTANDSFLKQGFIDKKSQAELLDLPELRAEEQEELLFENASNIEFDKKKIRNEFAADLEKVKSSLVNTEKLCPLIVDGVERNSFESFETINPSNHTQKLATIYKAGIEDCNIAISGAESIQPTWAALDVETRAKVLYQTANAFEKKRNYLSSILVLEGGKAWKEADAEVSEAIDFLNYYADRAIEIFNENKLVSLTGERNTNVYQSLGISLTISPWNFPLAIMLGMSAASLVCGNAVLIKPSTQTCLIAYEGLLILLDNLEKVCGKKYRKLISFLPGSGSVIGEYLINHKKVQSIAFTGSNATGMRINEAASKSRPVKKYISEMGGKNPMIIDKTADLDEAIPGVIYAAYGFSGQKCSACSRVIIVDEIYDEFKKRILEALEEVSFANPENSEVYSGPVIDESAFENISNYIEIAETEGDVIYGAKPVLEDGYFVQPVLVENLSLDSKIAKEEIFGPVLAMFRAKDLQDAIDIANDTEFGLTAGLFSRSPLNIEEVTKKIDAGNFYINRPCTGAVVARQAFGGLKNSSIGFKAGGPNYLLQFVKEKTITENTMRRGFSAD